MEYLLCVRRSNAGVFDVFDGQAQRFEGDSAYLHQRICHMPMCLIQRTYAETALEWLQLVPYVVFRDTNDHVFSYWRGPEAGEKRLHGKLSIGVGGHLSHYDIADALQNPAKLDEMAAKYNSKVLPLSCVSQHMSEVVLRKGLHRELREEVGFQAADNALLDGKLKYILHDRTDAVGKVHLGLVYEVPVQHREELQPTAELSHCAWLPWAMHDDFENWSKLLVQA